VRRPKLSRLAGLPDQRYSGDAPLLYFFFGTLLDLELLARVAGSHVSEWQTRPAVIAGYRRTGVIGRGYPILVRDPASRTDGIIVTELGPRAMRRLDRYEGPNYRLTPVTVVDRSCRPVDAVVFLVADRLRSNRRHWRLDVWQRRWKRRAMRRAGRLKDPPLAT